MGIMDKMMRVAGRSSDGLARAIKTSDKGELITVPSERIIELGAYSAPIELGENLILSNVDMAKCAYYFIQVSALGDWEVSTQTKRTTTTAFEDKQKIFAGTYRAISEWQEVKGLTMDVFINCLETEPIGNTAYIRVMGVR